MSFDRDQFRDEVKGRVDLVTWIERDGVVLKGGGREYMGLCPFHPDRDPSMSVFNKDGWGFYCHSCGTGGDIFEWVMKRQGLDFVQALKLVANSMGMSMPEPRLYQPPKVKAAAVDLRPPAFNPDKFVELDPDSAAGRYLVEKRLLPLEMLKTYRVRQTPDGDAYVFGYQWHPPGARNGRLEFCKVVKVDRPNGKKVEWREPKGGRNVLFGMLAVPKEADRLVITEGEIDAITWATVGVPAVSVPSGATYTGWIEICWEWLSRFKSLHISFDEDRAGRVKVLEVVKRLGMARTDIVHMPEKEEA